MFGPRQTKPESDDGVGARTAHSTRLGTPRMMARVLRSHRSFAPPNHLARRLYATAARLPAEQLPPDVHPSTGLCADGRVRIAHASEMKGLGAFAVAAIEANEEVGCYAGELLTFGQLLSRYGDAGGEGPGEYEAANAQAAWIAERTCRGVGVTGQYIFNAATCPKTRRTLLLDAEDPAQSNWTRFLNHSARRPNLLVARNGGGGDGGESIPLVRFVAARSIAPGEELTFDYGEGVELEVLDFEE